VKDPSVKPFSPWTRPFPQYELEEVKFLRSCFGPTPVPRLRFEGFETLNRTQRSSNSDFPLRFRYELILSSFFFIPCFFRLIASYLLFPAFAPPSREGDFGDLPLLLSCSSFPPAPLDASAFPSASCFPVSPTCQDFAPCFLYPCLDCCLRPHLPFYRIELCLGVFLLACSASLLRIPSPTLTPSYDLSLPSIA